MKKFWMVLILIGAFGGVAGATDVDLRDKDTDKPIQSPSEQNKNNPSGQAPGGPYVPEPKDPPTLPDPREYQPPDNPGMDQGDLPA